MPNKDIDLTDIPLQGGNEGWTRPGLKRDGEVVLEPDVLEFFKESGDASAQRINAALREYVQAHRKTA